MAPYNRYLGVGGGAGVVNIALCLNPPKPLPLEPQGPSPKLSNRVTPY